MTALKLGIETASLVNHLMSGAKGEPKVGEGATILQWTDREAYEVLEVSDNGKRAIIQKYSRKRIDNNGMGECQTYEYKELEGGKLELIYKWGAWRIKIKMVDFVKGYEYKSEDAKELFDENNLLKVVEGKTKLTASYNKVNIVWGFKDEYFDYGF